MIDSTGCDDLIILGESRFDFHEPILPLSEYPKNRRCKQKVQQGFFCVIAPRQKKGSSCRGVGYLRAYERCLICRFFIVQADCRCIIRLLGALNKKVSQTSKSNSETRESTNRLLLRFYAQKTAVQPLCFHCSMGNGPVKTATSGNPCSYCENRTKRQQIVESSLSLQRVQVQQLTIDCTQLSWTVRN